jgi:flagellar FliJ protein
VSTPRQSALDLAIEQATQRHLGEEKALAGARTQLHNAQTTHATLDAYRAEYAGRLRHVATATQQALLNHRRFLDKLTLALDQQQHEVDVAGEAVVRQQAAWLESMRKLKAMELLRSRRAAAEQHRLRRIEQKQSDEFAARGIRRAQAAANP